MKKIAKTTCPTCAGKGTVTDLSAIGSSLVATRKRLGLSIRDLALLMNCSFGYLGDLETGRRSWNEELIAKTEKALAEATKKIPKNKS